MRVRADRRCRIGLGSFLIAAALLAGAVRTSAQAGDRFSASGLHYRLEGRGPDIVLIHAFHMDLREWDDVVESLSESRRVMRYDVRGHGKSKVTSPLPSSVADLLSLLDELKIARATFVGLSMGSNIALELWRGNPRAPVYESTSTWWSG
jgi:alpha-beta hydrolase superfamily lysophospholipase